MTQLKEKLRTAALASAALTALLGTSPFRFYDMQLVPGSAFPAVVVQVVSRAPRYSVTARAKNPVQSRVQFTIWGGPADTGTQACRDVEAALESFLDGFNALGIPGLVQYPNNVVLARDAFYAQTDPGIYQRVIDVMMFDNENL